MLYKRKFDVMEAISIEAEVNSNKKRELEEEPKPVNM